MSQVYYFNYYSTPNSWDNFSPPFVEPVPTKRGKFVIKVMFLRLLLALLPPNWKMWLSLKIVEMSKVRVNSSTKSKFYWKLLIHKCWILFILQKSWKCAFHIQLLTLQWNPVFLFHRICWKWFSGIWSVINRWIHS